MKEMCFICVNDLNKCTCVKKKHDASASGSNELLCVGEFEISKLPDGNIWLVKQDGEGSGFDASLFESWLNDFFNENF